MRRRLDEEEEKKEEEEAEALEGLLKAPLPLEPAGRPRPRLVGKAAVALATVAAVWLAARFAAARSIAVQALLLVPWAWPGVEGMPARCGSDARRTWLWMHPARFNATTAAARERSSRGAKAVFLVGCGHSGTTPLTTVLSRHPQLWLYAPDAALEYSVKPTSFAAVPPAVLAPLVPARDDDARFQAAARAKNGSQTKWLVKSPSNVCRLGYIFATLPAARVILLVRDGRDVMLSLLERYPDADPAGPLVLSRWVNDNRAALVYAADPRLLVVRYEDLFSHRSRGKQSILVYVSEKLRLEGDVIMLSLAFQAFRRSRPRRRVPL